MSYAEKVRHDWPTNKNREFAVINNILCFIFYLINDFILGYSVLLSRQLLLLASFIQVHKW